MPEMPNKIPVSASGQASIFANPLKGKIALVTGASRNLGAGFARALAQAGADVIIHYHSNASKEDAANLEQSLRDFGGRVSSIQADLTSLKEVELLFDHIEADYGALDILVNNAGKMHKAPMHEVSEAQYDALFQLNTKSAFFLMREAAKRVSNDGRIINIGTSLLGAFTGYYSAYSGSKAPLEDFSKALAKEVGSRGITVNTVCPGPLDTPFLRDAETEETLAWLASASVTNRLGKVEDITPWIVFLASDAAGWATGQTFFVNGGFVTR
ncbi:SDR family oxidoreductase [Cohaesibacter gelatinilyticus]|uniref:NAD(P)-dependent dehydrogenase, short-chain alcohol dehydrogenase family n=1 Tax=Cohaesibacter gelatinilyticus TaxID=372072 RepID=A0A285PHI8_9HYPH|nr:SDR family oxidoreductase [Cohaesibacter gelatinilyticus]SNZ19596.1 NAD(P)-dependent dehydrogenase, short-chain alcohol dehydrogenase family [Cohaesibacter gelatinilyticus]